MAIDNQYDVEVVDGATKFQKRKIAVSTRSSPTDKSKAHLEAAYRDTHRQVYQVDQVPTEATYRERNHEVDQMVTEADFQTRLPSQAACTSQCHLPMTTNCKIYSPELGQRKLD
jgi:hypothetical protein